MPKEFEAEVLTQLNLHTIDISQLQHKLDRQEKDIDRMLRLIDGQTRILEQTQKNLELIAKRLP